MAEGGSDKVSRRGFLVRLAVGLGGIAGGLVILRRVFLPPALDAEGMATLTALLDTLLPDGEHPGYRATGILPRLHRELAATRLGRRALADGMAHLDAAARRQGASSFAKLSAAKRAAVVRTMADAEPGSLPFFAYRSIRDRAMELHYAQPAAWRPLGLPHPPQPDGYEDYTEPPHA